MRDLESDQQKKKIKQMPKQKLHNLIVKILPQQTTQLQIVVRHFLENKHSIVVLQGLI